MRTAKPHYYITVRNCSVIRDDIKKRIRDIQLDIQFLDEKNSSMASSCSLFVNIASILIV